VNKRSKLTVGILSGVIVGMLGLSFAAEPLYKAFCAVTGFGGTTQVAVAKPTEILDRTVRVAFDANVEQGAPIQFRALQPHVDIKLGETMMAFYEVTNLSNEPIRAMASFNVVPHKIGRYFEKLQCFCFEEQTYEPGKTVKLPVVFFVSPDMAKDWQADDVRGITLSYTYYRATGPQAAARLEDASAVN
jgi:cytochrome c oxidase assembly protein subunit 11